MKHPAREELISILYGETPKTPELNEHLKTCDECRAQLETWRALQADLDTWKLAPVRRRSAAVPMWGKWAAAAAIMLLAAFGFGRFTAPGVDTQQLSAAIEEKLQRSFQEQLNAAREADRKEWIAMLRDVEEQRLADYTELRQDLETVAVVADEKLTSTERAITHLNLVAQSESSTPITE